MNNSSDEPIAPCDEVGTLLDELDATVMRMARLMTARHGTADHGTELAPPHYMFLSALEENMPMRVSEIAERLGMKSPAVSMALQGLEEKGYITREHDADDRRVVQVALTDEGARCLKRTKDGRRKMMQLYTSALTLEDLRTFVRINTTLIETVTAQNE
ncbi:MAG: MarR family transcriptional regulator [Coriobacteriia bacterium]|nr:MarR family transcriptional regulator [Coriobacteriia bacterium]